MAGVSNLVYTIVDATRVSKRAVTRFPYKGYVVSLSVESVTGYGDLNDGTIRVYEADRDGGKDNGLDVTAFVFDVGRRNNNVTENLLTAFSWIDHNAVQ